MAPTGLAESVPSGDAAAQSGAVASSEGGGGGGGPSSPQSDWMARGDAGPKSEGDGRSRTYGRRRKTASTLLWHGRTRG